MYLNTPLEDIVGKFYRTPVQPRPEKVQYVAFWILRDARTYAMRRIKDPLRKAILFVYKKLPESKRMSVLSKVLMMISGRMPIPTKENTSQYNTHILIDLRDRFFKHWDNPDRKELFEAVWNIFISEYEHDSDMARPFDHVVMWLKQSDWKPPELGMPRHYWKHFEDKVQQ